MPTSELSSSNYRRIFYINCLLSVPLIILFAWPYIAFGYIISLRQTIFYPGALLFSLPFALTIMHGHVTLSLGSAHRHHYYDWLEDHPLTYGLLFHRIFSSTRFRLIIFALSVIVFLAGRLLRF